MTMVCINLKHMLIVQTECMDRSYFKYATW